MDREAAGNRRDNRVRHRTRDARRPMCQQSPPDRRSRNRWPGSAVPRRGNRFEAPDLGSRRRAGFGAVSEADTGGARARLKERTCRNQRGKAASHVRTGYRRRPARLARRSARFERTVAAGAARAAARRGSQRPPGHTTGISWDHFPTSKSATLEVRSERRPRRDRHVVIVSVPTRPRRKTVSVPCVPEGRPETSRSRAGG